MAAFGYRSDPDQPGWLVRPASSDGGFLDVYGELRVRAETQRRARMTVAPDQRHLNIVGTLHGGFLMAIVDHALFAAPMALGIENAAGGVTIDASVQFLAPAKDGRPLEAVVDVLRETRRMIFMRGLIEQDGEIAVSFTGVIKKASSRK